jgi:hypothetical protein
MASTESAKASIWWDRHQMGKREPDGGRDAGGGGAGGGGAHGGGFSAKNN